MDTKHCSGCGEEKPHSAFQIRRASSDGMTSRCKACLAAYDARRYQEQPTRREQALRCSLSPAGAAAKKRWATENPVKRKAQVAVGNAIRDGKLNRQACSVCGEDKAQAHHHDYSMPLDVIWLCPKHHRMAHADNDNQKLKEAL